VLTEQRKGVILILSGGPLANRKADQNEKEPQKGHGKPHYQFKEDHAINEEFSLGISRTNNK